MEGLGGGGGGERGVNVCVILCCLVGLSIQVY